VSTHAEKLAECKRINDAFSAIYANVFDRELTDAERREVHAECTRFVFIAHGNGPPVGDPPLSDRPRG
jgi:hypothetical protein